jgi:hypothetical protein
MALVIQGCATSWVKRTPHEDDHYRFYVGRSYNVKSPSDGLDAARADAKMRAIEESFGAQVKFQRDTHETIDAAQVIERSRAISRSVHLEGFEEVEVHQDEIDDDLYNTAVLFRYPKSAIRAEKERLGKNPEKDEEIKFDHVDSTPRARESGIDHRAIQSTFVFGLGLGGSSPTMREVDNSVITFRLQGEMRLSRYVGLNVSTEFGGKSITYTNGTLGVSRTEIALGLPIYFTSADRSSWTPFIEPTFLVAGTGINFADSSGTTTSSTSKWQFGAGVNLGTQIRFLAGDWGGLSIRPQCGANYLTGSGVTTAPAFQGGLLLQWEFFKK